jgi:hypothetical protein
MLWSSMSIPGRVAAGVVLASPPDEDEGVDDGDVDVVGGLTGVDVGGGFPREITMAGVCDRSDMHPSQGHCAAALLLLFLLPLPLSSKHSLSWSKITERSYAQTCN